ncbi:hypothetical protein V495_05025 [Pseudogymnoascus sp. VKM F-4514 (FW-929)]|nr:hypothetical protein V495_05025 [Pseudogymnoascus sp. VKM F-4514 (FW-929)]KFY63331.1 hypothetical protein V497_02052 [Pseudogymnoascus sp. VKM F-4516 (FW-969)]
MAASAPFQFLPLGAIIQTFQVGRTNVVQGFPTAELYEKFNSPYFGETIGRTANRIKGAKIEFLNGKSYCLAANDGPNNLHGGVKGWGKRVWNGPLQTGNKEIPGLKGEKFAGETSVKFTLRSEDGDEGFPGDVDATVTYTTGTQVAPDGKKVHILAIEYQAELVGSADETVINMTNHSYFNLSGEPTIADTDVALSTNLYLPVDDGGIPTGDPTVYEGVEPSKAFTLGASEPDKMIALLTAYHPKTAIHLEVHATEPAFQFYTGKYIDVPSVEDLPARGPRSGFCVEPSRYVNAANVEAWKDQVVLKKGDVYGSRTVYRAWSDIE